MSKKIISLSLSRIPKLDFPGVVKGLFEILEKYGPGAYFLQGVYNLLHKKKALVSNLRQKYSKISQTDDLKVLRVKRKDVLKAIQRQKLSMMDANIASMADDLKLVLPFLNEYFGNILANNPESRTTRIENMFSAMDGSVELKAALAAVGLTVYLEELRVTQNLIDLKIVERREEVSAMPKMITNQVKADFTEAITDLRNAIEIAVKEHPEVDYMPMVNEINALFMPFQVKIKSQNTRRKTAIAAKKIAEAAKPITEDGLKSA